MFSLNGTDGHTYGNTDGQTNGRTVRLYYAPNFIWGHKKCMLNYINPINCVSVLNLGLLFTHQILFLYPQHLFLGGILESAFRSVDQADGLSVGRSSDGRSFCKILYIQILLQFHYDPLDNWHTYYSVIEDVQDPIFPISIWSLQSYGPWIL